MTRYNVTTLVAGFSLTASLLALPVADQTTRAGPPEGVSGKMVFDDASALQGPWVWRAVEAVMNGKIDKEPETIVFTFVRGTFVWKHGDTVLFKGTFNLDVSRKPRAIDMRVTFTPLGEGGEYVWPGIYRLGADGLKLCVRMMVDEGRPKEFASSKKTSHDCLLTLKKEKP